MACNCGSPIVHSHNRKFTQHQVRSIDPTRMTTLRKKFVSDMNSRFIQLRSAIRQSIVDQDCFGLNSDVVFNQLFVNKAAKDNQVSPTTFKQFSFGSSTAKIDAFMKWLVQQEQLGILEIQNKEQLGTPVQNVWANVYIKSAYAKGIQSAQKYIKKVEKRLRKVDLPESIAATMQGAVHADRVGLIYSRNYAELKGVTGDMDQKITRVLATAMIQGKGPLEIARELSNTIDMSARRAERVARTEMMSAYHKATVQEYRNAGFAGVEVQAEFVTAGYNVCPICSALEGKIYSLDEVENLIPVHPNCRCTTIPVITEEK